MNPYIILTTKGFKDIQKGIDNLQGQVNKKITEGYSVKGGICVYGDMHYGYMYQAMIYVPE